jgi:hypothetical protein
LYDPDDRRTGYPELVPAPAAATRERVPLLTISLGVATTGERQFRRPEEVVEVANEAKRRAKNEAGSTWWTAKGSAAAAS